MQRMVVCTDDDPGIRESISLVVVCVGNWGCMVSFKEDCRLKNE